MMKKLISILFAAGLLSALAFAADEAPVYDGPGAENATVLQLNKETTIGQKYEKFEDYLWVQNYSEHENIALSIYLYDAKKSKSWKKLGDAKVNGFFKIENIENEFEHKLDKYEYFAIVPTDGNKYSYLGRRKFQNLYIVKNHILVICVFSVPEEETPESVRNAAYVFEPKNISGKYRDVVKFFNKSQDANMNFFLYGFNNKDDKHWTRLGMSDLKENGDLDMMETELTCDYISSFNYLAIISDNGKTYEYDVKKKNNDLQIEVK